MRARGPWNRSSKALSAPGVVIDRLFRRESGQAVAALARAFGDLDRAEEAVQDAFVVALERWPRDGVPPNPAAWIALTARRRAIDRLRRDRRHNRAVLARVDAIGGGGGRAPPPPPPPPAPRPLPLS